MGLERGQALTNVDGRPQLAIDTVDPGVEPDDRIEIVLPDGTALRVPEAIGTVALRRILAALRG